MAIGLPVCCSRHCLKACARKVFKELKDTRRYGPLRGPISSSCEGLWASAEAFFAFRAKKRAYYAVLAHLCNFWCQVVTLVTFSSNLSNFERNPKKPTKKNIENPKKIKRNQRNQKKYPKNPKNKKNKSKKNQNNPKNNSKNPWKNPKIKKNVLNGQNIQKSQKMLSS